VSPRVPERRMEDETEVPFFDRELSWLAFNGRVLQEADDPKNPLFERLTFLSIFSSNLDEFFRVRVASLRSLLRLKKKRLSRLGVNPVRLLTEIHKMVTVQQERFGETFRGRILPELERHGIFLVNESGVTTRQGEFLRSYYQEHVAEEVKPIHLDPSETPPFLRNQCVYLVVELWPEEPISLSAEKPHYALVEIPSPPLPRFVELPTEGERHVVMFLDDVIRTNLPAIFPGWDVGGAFAVKLTRDAELHLEDEFSDDLLSSIRNALAKRETGVPSRFLYDMQASYALVTFLKEALRLEDEDLVVGGRYHNLHDLADFPRFGMDELSFEPWTPHRHPELDQASSVFDVVREKDHLLHFPYHSYEPVVRFLVEAAEDPDVEEIWLTVYRVSSDSKVLGALLDAAGRGKKVRVFVEVMARFDEASNLRWAERLQEAGILTFYSLPGLKVHAKIALVVRREGEATSRYTYLGTGNFNEKTARFYTDWGLLTSDPRITEDVESVFHFLAGEREAPEFRHCLVAPFNLRSGLLELIDAESDAARQGRAAGILAKMNSLEDREVIEHLYEASGAGVPVDMVVRGLCCLTPGQPGSSENIRIRSILDRYLEHARVYVFHADGEERMYLASADWMHRNLSRRVEVAFPIYDPDLRVQVRRYMDVQFADNSTARIIDVRQHNAYVPRDGAETPIRAQEAIREMVGALKDRRVPERAHGAST